MAQRGRKSRQQIELTESGLDAIGNHPQSIVDGLGPYKRYELLTGTITYPLLNYYSGYGDGRSTDLVKFISPEMRRDWNDNRADLMKFWRSGEVSFKYFSVTQCRPWLFCRGEEGTVPWASEMFD